MLRFHEKQSSPKKHITKLNLNLHFGTNMNPLIQATSNQDYNIIRQQSLTNTKKWNLFSPKVLEKKYAFDFFNNKNSRFHTNTHKNTRLELLLNLESKEEKNKNNPDKEENKNKQYDILIPNKRGVKTNHALEKFNNQNNKDQSINNTFEGANIINPEEIYNLSIVNYFFS